MLNQAMLFVTNLHFSKDGNGGQQRTYFLIKELSKHYNLYVLSPYPAENHLDIHASFILNKAVHYEKKLRAYKFTRLCLKILNRLFKHEEATKPIHQSNFATYILKKQIQNIQSQNTYQNINTIVFDTLSVVVDLKSSRFTHRILNAHNFDSELVQMNLDHKIKNPETSASEMEQSRKTLKTYQRYEHNIDAYFTEIWVCSVADELKFRAANPKTNVQFYELPNGSDTEARQFQPITNQYKTFLFVGSLNYFPNVNGLKWFIEEIFSKLPLSFKLNIVGKSPQLEDYTYLTLYPNVNLIGEVDAVEPYYSNHDVVVVPLLEGSGTRLKILEALSYGKLVVSTPKGIEGIQAKAGTDYLEFNNFETFKSNILNQLEDSDTLKTIRHHGRQCIEKSYSWKTIVENYVKQRHEQ